MVCLYYPTFVASAFLLAILESSSLLPSSSKLSELMVCIPLLMAPLLYLRVEKVVSRITSSSLLETFPEHSFLQRLITFELRIPTNGSPYSSSLFLLTWWMPGLGGNSSFIWSRLTMVFLSPFLGSFILFLLGRASNADPKCDLIHEHLWGNVWRLGHCSLLRPILGFLQDFKSQQRFLELL